MFETINIQILLVYANHIRETLFGWWWVGIGKCATLCVIVTLKNPETSGTHLRRNENKMRVPYVSKTQIVGIRLG